MFVMFYVSGWQLCCNHLGEKQIEQPPKVVADASVDLHNRKEANHTFTGA